MIILSQMPIFTFFFVNLVWWFQYQGYNFESQYRRFVWDLFTVALVVVGQFCLQLIIVMVQNERHARAGFKVTKQTDTIHSVLTAEK